MVVKTARLITQNWTSLPCFLGTDPKPQGGCVSLPPMRWIKRFTGRLCSAAIPSTEFPAAVACHRTHDGSVMVSSGFWRDISEFRRGCCRHLRFHVGVISKLAVSVRRFVAQKFKFEKEICKIHLNVLDLAATHGILYMVCTYNNI